MPIPMRAARLAAAGAIAALPAVGAALAAAPLSRATATAARPPQEAAASGAYTAEQAERGRAVYREHCMSCHGSSLRGGTNEFAAPALAGPFFFDAWSGRPVAELLGYSTDNMPPEGTLLPEADYVDVTAYILQVLGYPEGEAELTPDSPALARGIERQG
jgi:mono/diheme cytochrome c family protein